MPDREDHSATGRERSLLSLGDALRAGDAPAAGRLAQAVAQARARKEGLAEEFRRNKLRHAGQDRQAAEPSTAPPAFRQVAADGSGAPEPAREKTDEARTPPAAGEPAAQAPASRPADPQASPARAEMAAAEDDAIAGEADGRWHPLIDPAKVISGVINSKKIIAATTVAGALIGVMVALSTPKTYFAATELLADPRDLNLVDRELTQGGISNEATLAIVDNQVRIMKSGTVLSNVVQQLNLAADPEFNGTGKSGPFSYLSKVRSLFSSSDGAADPGRRTALAVMNLGKALTVERGGRTFVVLVGANTQDPEKSALIANTTSRVFLERYGQIASDSAGRAAGELSAKLDELRNAVETAERKVETFKAENDLIDAQGRLITDDEIVKLNDQLGVARARTLEIKARSDVTRGADADAVIGGSLPEELSSATIQELRTQYSTLKGESDRLAVRLGPRHPQLLAVEAQLGGLRDQIGSEIRRIAAATQTELRRAVELEQQLSSRLAQLKVRQGDLSGEMVTLRELERDATAKRAVYEAYLLRAKETSEQQGINSANINIISEATPPFESSSTSRSVTAMTGTVLGFLFGVGVGAARGGWAGLSQNMRNRRRRAGPRPRKPVDTMFDHEPAVPPALVEETAADATPQAAAVPRDVRAETDQTAADASAQSRQEPMHRPYASDYPPVEQPRQAHDHPYGTAHPYPYPPMAPPVAAMSPAHYGYPAAPGYAAPYGYPQAGPMPGQGYPQPAAAPYWQQPPHPAMAYPQPYPPPQPYAPAEPDRYAGQPRRDSQAAHMTEASLDEIRASLRECREAIRELAEHRAQRRYF
ncbi:MAG: succinoglycan biosynthesis protein exop [Rhizobiaceae bacterium]|nr:succinoglycan biosynthesis protein exop [Rhizobiaceae bacterium]